MAKLSALELTNQFLQRIGETGDLTVLTALTPIQLVCWNAIQDVIREIAALGNWIPLETAGTFTLLTSTNTYAIPADMISENIYSFRSPDNDDNIEFLTPKEWYLNYPKGVTTATTGYPTRIMREDDKFQCNKMPAAAQNTKIIYFRYNKRSDLLLTATPAGTCWFPEGTEQSVLINLAVYKVLVYKNSPEAPDYYNRVFGGRGIEGTLDIMRRQYLCPPARVKPLVTAIL